MLKRGGRTAATKGFTLIELLIVVAIIAILAAIALPNFLEAQTRAKVARCANDLRTQAVALEAYFVDWNSYTRDSDSSLDIADIGPAAANPAMPEYGKAANGARQLTTPIAYMTSLLADPFGGPILVEGGGAQGYRIGSGTWSYSDPPINPHDHQDSHLVFKQVGPRACYVLIGVGPDRARCRNAYKCFPFVSMYEGGASENLRKNQPLNYTDYDPTNGTMSLGDIYRFGGEWQNGRFMRNGGIVGSTVSPGGSCW